MGAIVGRDDELELIHAFLGEPVREPRALVLEGEAGIGKSTLWHAAVTAASARMPRVLTSRPSEAERGLAFAGLGDLFEPVLDDVLPHLPAPRRTALRVALLVEEAKEAVDPRALAVAVRSALEILAADGSFVLAIDDVQWLDRSSSSALAFALRRIEGAVVVLLARRVAEDAVPSALEASLAAGSVERLHVGPLSVGATHTLLRDRLDRVFARPTLLRIHETSGGNPFYALELARALDRDVDATEPLPVPETLDGLVSARLSRLPESTREPLALVAAIGLVPTAAMAAAGFSNDVLEPAILARVVERDDGWIRFTHPLLASGLYQALTEGEQRAAHRLAARVVEDPVGRARHLALASDHADAEIAAALEDAASVASVRGAPMVAVELGELARRLTPEADREGSHRRAILAALAQLRAGDIGRARALALELLEGASPGRERAEALMVSSSVESQAGDVERAIGLRREALREAHSDLDLQAAINQWLAVNVPRSDGRRVREEHARASLAVAEQLGDDALRAGALAVLATLCFEAGDPGALGFAEEAHELATSRARREQVPPRIGLAHLLAWSYDRFDLVATFTFVDMLVSIRDFERARALLDDLDQDVAARDELLVAKALWVRSTLEVTAGRWTLAADFISREREIVRQYGGHDHAGPFVELAELALHRGELDTACELAAHGRDLAAAEVDMTASLEAIVGLANRAAGELESAIERFVAAERIAESCGWAEPALVWWRAEFAETLLEAGRIDEAVRLLDAWEPDARRLGRNWVIAHATRCRGLAAAARGDVDEAVATLELAVEQIEPLEDPFGRARALLALGVARRRARRRGGAREAIGPALAAFEELGEATWTERARAELGRIGGRTREEGLTPAELRVAALVAEGRTNREVAAALFLGERTVETHLSHIYSKLGVRSRTELARVYEPVS